jgi:hypothetical protein
MAQGDPVTYTVTAVAPETQFTSTATPLPGKRVSFSTSAGYDGGVFVPDSVFSDTAAVRDLIEGEVRKVTAALALTGTVTGA